MKALILLSLTLFFSHSAFALVNCDASVSYTYKENGKVKTESQKLTTSLAPDRENTIVAQRTFGLLLSVTISADESVVTDTTNYVNKLSDGKNVMISNEIMLPWGTDNTVALVHKSSEGTTEDDTVNATFTMICRRQI